MGGGGIKNLFTCKSVYFRELRCEWSNMNVISCDEAAETNGYPGGRLVGGAKRSEQGQLR